MDIIRLDSEAYQPDVLVQNLSSIIWTERYQELGEFELRSSYIEKTMALLPECSLISHLETEEVMMVESHSIEEDGNGHVLVTKGRSAECILEGRVFSDAAYGKKIKMQRTYTLVNALLVFLWDSIANTTDKNVSTLGGYAMNPLDVVENIVITDSTIKVGTAVTRRLENVNVWDQMRFWIGAGKFGIRMIRPTKNSIARKTAHVTAAGVITKPLEVATGLTMDIYEGLDRTSMQTVNTPVVFSDEFGHIDSPSYFFSSRDYKNVAIVISASGPLHGREVMRPLYDSRSSDGGKTGPPSQPGGGGSGGSIAVGEPHGGMQPAPSGWDRRVRLVDAGTKEDGETTTEFLASLNDTGMDTLVAENERQTVLDGTVTSNAPYSYKKDYNLGDKVSLMGKYNVVKEMQVQEYTYAQDDAGERGFPGLVLWT